MPQLLPPNAPRGQGCFGHSTRESRIEMDHRCQDEYEKLKEFLKGRLSSTIGKLQTDLDETDGNHHNDIIRTWQRNLEGELKERLSDSQCFSIQGMDWEDLEYGCSPFHIVWCPKLYVSNGRTSGLGVDVMRELTRHWAVCEPRETLIIAPKIAVDLTFRGAWKDWGDTYKFWGGNIECLGIEIRSRGYDVSTTGITSV